MVTERLDKLRTLIVHIGTPEHERRAALRRLETLIANDCLPGGSRTVISRSTRIGHKRRPTAIDEFGRIETYAAGYSYGDVIRDIFTACRACACCPASIDFGYHDSKEAVLALRFHAGSVPNVMDLQGALRHRWRNARITLANRDAQEAEKLLLLYLGVHESTGDETMAAE